MHQLIKSTKSFIALSAVFVVWVWLWSPVYLMIQSRRHLSHFGSKHSSVKYYCAEEREREGKRKREGEKERTES